MKRGYSLMLFSHPDGKTRKFFFSNRAAKVSISLLGSVLIGFIAMFFLFAQTYKLSKRVKALEAENARLAEENMKINELSRRMAELETVRRRLAKMLGVEISIDDSTTRGGSETSSKNYEVDMAQDRWTPRGKPVDGIISRGYSPAHPGIDIAAKTDAPVVATADGVVLDASYDSTYGNYVIVDHNGKFRTFYGHLSRYTVHKGQGVTRGDILGFVGTTGKSTGPHLHYEVVRENNRTNPILYLF